MREVCLRRIRAAAAAGGDEIPQPEIDHLIRGLPRAGGADAEALAALGAYYWSRSRRGRDRDELSEARALLLLVPVFLDRPAAVPAEVNAVLSDLYGHPTRLTEGGRDVLLGVALLDIAAEFDQPGLLDAAIVVLERAARSGTTDDAGRAEVLDVLGAALCARCDERRRTGDEPDAADVGRAADCFHTAYLLSDAADPFRSARLLRWGAVLVSDPRDADASATGVAVLCTAIGASTTAEERRFPLAKLAERLAFDVPFPLPPDAFALACATVDGVTASRPTDDDRPELLGARLALSGALYARGDPTAGERAVALSREAADPAVPPSWLAGLAELLRAMCGSPSPALVDAAVAVHRRLVDTVPGVDLQYLVDLADLLALGYRLDRTRPTSGESVEILHRVMGAADRGSAMYLHARQLFSVALADIALSTGADEDIERAVAAARIVVGSGEPAGALPTVLNNLALLLRLRHERSGTGLTEAIGAMRRALALDERTDDRPDALAHAERLGNLAILLAQDGQVDVAGTTADEAVRRAPAGDASHQVHAARTTVLRLVHDRRGGEVHQERAIASLRALVPVAPDPISRAVRLADLAVALRKRYTDAGDTTALAEAVDAYRRALPGLPVGHRLRVPVQAGLVVSLGELARRTGDPHDVDEAIDLGREVVAATPAGSRELGGRLTNLARMFTHQFRRTGDRQLLDEAIDLDRRAVVATADDDPQLGMRLNNLAVSLSLLADAAEDARATSMAVEAARRAVAATDPEHPQRGSRLANLAAFLAADAEAGGGRDRDRLREAQHVAGQVAHLPATTPSARRLAYRVLAICLAAEGRWAGAAEAFTAGVRQLPLIAGRNLHRADAEHRLAGIEAIHVDAAACWVEAADPGAALTALELGRGVLLSYALDARTELTDLQQTDPALADEVQRILRELDHDDEPRSGSDRRHRLRASWDDVLHRVRALPGFAHFAAAPPVGALLSAARSGPVVVVNVSEYRCDALIVLPTGVRVVPLPRLGADEVGDRARAFLPAVEATARGDGAERTRGEREVEDTYGWLWDVVAEPVLDALALPEPRDAATTWPHLWWSPTGLLQFLPLHAAGHHDRPGRSVLDRVVSSYTPTVRALQHARSRPPATGDGLLSVAMSQTEGDGALPASVAEASSVAALARRSRLLIDEAATVGEVVAALRQCSTAHFACHAVSDVRSPSANRLLLHDGPLTVREISRLQLPDAEFAFLSACATARGDDRLADEAIHLVSAFQLAGYRHVVGTLWPIVDPAAARVARQFYARRRVLPPADALHAVVRRLRADAPHRPSLWGAHVHAGP
jgi:tetratricopeptide (TPR) repeat protein